MPSINIDPTTKSDGGVKKRPTTDFKKNAKTKATADESAEFVDIELPLARPWGPARGFLLQEISNRLAILLYSRSRTFKSLNLPEIASITDQIVPRYLAMRTPCEICEFMDIWTEGAQMEADVAPYVIDFMFGPDMIGRFLGDEDEDYDTFPWWHVLEAKRNGGEEERHDKAEAALLSRLVDFFRYRYKPYSDDDHEWLLVIGGIEAFDLSCYPADNLEMYLELVDNTAAMSSQERADFLLVRTFYNGYIPLNCWNGPEGFDIEALRAEVLAEREEKMAEETRRGEVEF